MSEFDAGKIKDNIKEQVEGLYGKLEKLTSSLSSQFKDEIIPEVEKKTKEHPFTALLAAFTTGFLAAFLLFGMRKK